MKVIGILGAHKENGLTAKMLQTVMDNLPQTIKQETIYLENYEIKPLCEGETNSVLEQLYQNLESANVLIIAAPTYWQGLAGMMKNLFDCLRTLMLKFGSDGSVLPGSLENKRCLSLRSCYADESKNAARGITDESLQMIDRVMSTAGLDKIGEIILTGTAKMTELPTEKIEQAHQYTQQIAQ